MIYIDIYLHQPGLIWTALKQNVSSSTAAHFQIDDCPVRNIIKCYSLKKTQYKLAVRSPFMLGNEAMRPLERVLLRSVEQKDYGVPEDCFRYGHLAENL